MAVYMHSHFSLFTDNQAVWNTEINTCHKLENLQTLANWLGTTALLNDNLQNIIYKTKFYFSLW